MTTTKATTATKSRRGRPHKDVDVAQLEQMARIGSPITDMALALGVSVDTLERNYAEVIKVAQAAGRSALLSRMARAAILEGNMTAMIWLSKQPVGRGIGLGFRDSYDLDHSTGGQPLPLFVAKVVIE
jgi:hypothetical protein